MSRRHRQRQRAWVSADGRGSLSQDLPAVFIAQRWKGSHRECFTDPHGNRTNLPCHRHSRSRAESWVSQLQASATPRPSPHHGNPCSSCITRCIKSLGVSVSNRFWFLSWLFQLHGSSFLASTRGLSPPKSSCLGPRCKSGVLQLELQRSRD